jgi:hypothetical protein
MPSPGACSVKRRLGPFPLHQILVLEHPPHTASVIPSDHSVSETRPPLRSFVLNHWKTFKSNGRHYYKSCWYVTQVMGSGMMLDWVRDVTRPHTYSRLVCFLYMIKLFISQTSIRFIPSRNYFVLLQRRLQQCKGFAQSTNHVTLKDTPSSNKQDRLMSKLAEPKTPSRKINDSRFVTHIYPVFTEEINLEARDKHKQINYRRGGGGKQTRIRT